MITSGKSRTCLEARYRSFLTKESMDESTESLPHEGAMESLPPDEASTGIRPLPEDTTIIMKDNDAHRAPQKKRTESSIQELAKKDARALWKQRMKKHMQKGSSSISSMTDSMLSSMKEMKTKAFWGKHYEAIVLFLVLTNAFFVGWQIQWIAVHGGPPLLIHEVAEWIFFFIFGAELIVRYRMQGRATFFGMPELAWNMFDVLVVVFMLLELSGYQFVFIEISVLRIVRVVRIMRVVRIVRTGTFFRELRMMLYSVMSSMRSLVWVAFVLMMTFYIFATLFTQATIDFKDRMEQRFNTTADGTEAVFDVEGTYDNLCEYFGTLDRSIFTLFGLISCGVSWVSVYGALSPMAWQYRAAFLVYVSVSIFCIRNVVTSIFVENAMHCSEGDKELVIQEELLAKDGYMDSIKSMFYDLDTDQSGTIGLNELERAMTNENMLANFNALGLDITDVQSLFLLLDTDHTNALTIEEFLVGCMRLKGSAKSLDVAKMTLELEWVVETLKSMFQHIRETRKVSGALPVSRHPLPVTKL